MKLLNELLELPLLLLLLLLLPLTPRLINERVPMTEMRFRTSIFHSLFSIYRSNAILVSPVAAVCPCGTVPSSLSAAAFVPLRFLITRLQSF